MEKPPKDNNKFKTAKDKFLDQVMKLVKIDDVIIGNTYERPTEK